MIFQSRNKTQSKIFLLFIIIVLSFSAYSFTVTNSFKTLDDYGTIIANPNIKSFANIKKIFTTSHFGIAAYYRPMLQLSFMIDYHFFGLNAFYYYLTNIFLHLLVSIFVFLLVKEFFDDTLMPFFVSLLFAIHPVHWVTVCTITGRSSSIVAVFFIAAVYFFCRSKNRGDHYGYYAASLICFLGALLSRETAVMIPIILFSYLCLTRFSDLKGVLKELMQLIPFFCILGIYFLMRQFLGIVSLFQERTLGEIALGFMTFLRALITHLRLFIFPVDLHFDRTRMLFSDFQNLELYLTAAFFITFMVIVFLARQRIPKQALFFLSWFFIILIPVSQIPVALLIQPGFITTGEHHLYIPSIGIFTCLVMGASSIYQKRTEQRIVSKALLKFAYGGLLVFLTLMTIQQALYSRDEFVLHRQTLKYEPHNIRMRRSYIAALVRVGLFQEVEHQYRQILKMIPYHAEARIGLGKSLADQGKLWEAIREYEKIDHAGKFEVLRRKNLQLTYSSLIKQFEDQLKRDPNNIESKSQLGRMLKKREELKGSNE